MGITKQKGRVGDSSENSTTEIATPLAAGTLAMHHNLNTMSLGTKNGNIVFQDKIGSQAMMDAVANKTMNAVFPFNGHVEIAKKAIHMKFYTDSNFTYSMTDANRFVNFNGNVVDTWGEELATSGDFNDGSFGGFNAGVNVDSTLEYTNAADYGYTYRTFTGLTAGAVYRVEIANIYNGVSTRPYVLDGTAGATLFDPYPTYNLAETKTVVGEVVAISSSFTVRLRNGAGIGLTGKWDKVSVKEITTVNMLGYLPEVQVETTTTTTTSVEAGDYVVLDKPELVTNGTFDSAIGAEYIQEGAGILTIDTGRGKLTSDGTNRKFAQELTTEVDKYYLVKTTYEKGTSASGFVRVGTTTYGSEIFSENYTVDTEVVVAFKATTTTTYINFINSTTTLGETNFFDNISVKQVDDIFRAERATSDMYDYDSNNNLGGTTNIAVGDIVKIIDTFSGTATVGNFYQAVQANATADLDTLNYTNPAWWTDLGTATAMSLDNPYFSVRDAVTNQVMALHKYNSTTKAYVGTVSEILFNDAYAVETTKAIMLKNGFSQVAKGLYSKGGFWYTTIGYWQTLNKGAYHEFWNKYGTNLLNASSGADQWHKSGVIQPASTAETFIEVDHISDSTTAGMALLSSNYGSIEVGYGLPINPQGKYYDIIYSDQFRDCREFAKIPTEAENKLVFEDLKENGVEDTRATEQTAQTTSGTVATLEVGNLNYTVGSVLQIYDVTNSAVIGRRTIKSVSGTTVTLNSTIVKTSVGDVYSISGGTTPITTQSSGLDSDIVSSPADNPQAIKDILASGKPLVTNFLLVDENGDSLIPDGVIDLFKLSRKAKTILSGIRSTDSDTNPSSPTYASFTPTSSLVDNNVTLTDEPVGNFVIVYYTALNNIAQKANPLPISKVASHVIASNSHSVYKGNRFTMLTGKIGVGNGANGYESRVLENNIDSDYEFLTSDYYGTSDSAYMDFEIQNIVYNDVSELGTTGYYRYTRAGISGGYTIGVVGTITNVAYFTYIGALNVVPTHSTITLDNSDSPASKVIEMEAYDEDGTVYYQVAVEEMKWDFTVDDKTELTSIDGTTSQTFTAGVLYLITGLDTTIPVYCNVGGTFAFNTLSHLGNTWVNNPVGVIFTDWDGNGFGENGEFEQLINGVKDDTNLNSVTTVIARAVTGLKG